MATRKNSSTTGASKSPNATTDPEATEVKKTTARKRSTTPKTESEKKPVKTPNFKKMSVSEYFDYVKDMKKTTDSESVRKMIEVCEGLLKKFNILNQREAAQKAVNALHVMKKDLELYEKGIKQYVHIDDVTKYLKTIADHSVKLIEVENFPREIPDDVIEKWLAVKDNFDQGFIVFTDYTEKTEAKDTVAEASGKKSTQAAVEEKRKEKDPILFGAVRVNENNSSLRGNTYEKLYFVADWIDEYCDLTFDKLVEKMSEELGENPVHDIKPIETKEDFKKEAGL